MPNAAVQAILNEFCSRAGVAPLRLDETGWCTLGLDDLIVHLDAGEDSELLAFNTWLGEAPEDLRADIALAIADANYLLVATQGTTLGMSRSTGDVTLAVQVPLEALTLARFERILSNFADIAMAFRSRLLSTASGVAATPARAEQNPGFALRA